MAVLVGAVVSNGLVSIASGSVLLLNSLQPVNALGVTPGVEGVFAVIFRPPLAGASKPDNMHFHYKDHLYIIADIDWRQAFWGAASC
ncbi:protein of unknown function [Nitratireductor aquimarinus]